MIEHSKLAEGEKPPELDEDNEHGADNVESLLSSLCWCEVANTLSQRASRACQGSSRLSQRASRVARKASRVQRRASSMKGKPAQVEFLNQLIHLLLGGIQVFLALHHLIFSLCHCPTPAQLAQPEVLSVNNSTHVQMQLYLQGHLKNTHFLPLISVLLIDV